MHAGIPSRLARAYGPTPQIHTPESSSSTNNSNGSLQSDMFAANTSGNALALTNMKLSVAERMHNVDEVESDREDELDGEADPEDWRSTMEDSERDNEPYRHERVADHSLSERPSDLRGKPNDIGTIVEDTSSSPSSESHTPSAANDELVPSADSFSEATKGPEAETAMQSASPPRGSPPPPNGSSDFPDPAPKYSASTLVPSPSTLPSQATHSDTMQTPPSVEEPPTLPRPSFLTPSQHSSPSTSIGPSTSSTLVPSVNIIPTSPTSPQSRIATGSLDIPSSPNVVISSEGHPRRRDTLGTMPSAGLRNVRGRSQDPRAINRLSGFFSSLFHHRERESPPVPEPPEQREPSPEPPEPSVIEPPILPPPPLPAPSLAELGLIMKPLTLPLTPPQFSNLPTSGVFLAPHYLLLCHSQGLDVLPLVSPPARMPYALVRRVAFKSVLVMEERGVLVAIAGRRDGVRVYALDEVRKAVEWRVEVEVERERERERVTRDRGGRKNGWGPEDSPDPSEKDQIQEIVQSQSTVLLDTPDDTTPPARHAPLQPASPPPLYSTLSSFSVSSRRPGARRSTSNLTVPQLNVTRQRDTSVSTIAGPSGSGEDTGEMEEKRDWMESRDSDDEALNPVAAASSGGAALDERTSVTATASAFVASPISSAQSPTTPPRRPSASTGLNRRSRPGNLDLSPEVIGDPVRRPPASPAPTLLSLRQALSHSRRGLQARPPRASTSVDDDGLDTPVEGSDSISFAQALMESRLPNIPPPGTQTQVVGDITSHASLISAAEASREAVNRVLTSDQSHRGPPTDSVSEGHVPTSRSSTPVERRRRKRWSVFPRSARESTDTISPRDPPPLPIPTSSSTSHLPSSIHSAAPSVYTSESLPAGRTPRSFTVSPNMSIGRASAVSIPASLSNALASSSQPPVPSLPATMDQPHADNNGLTVSPLVASPTSDQFSQPVINPLLPRPNPRSRFLPRLFAALGGSRGQPQQPPHNRTPKDNLASAEKSSGDAERKTGAVVPLSSAPAPKLEYVKLPGTKGAITIKAVETPKKSFLAILCGEAGEKVELFAGTYRTALSLSRTFILPDSPRSLELQLQGDDLVEVFLVFSQNVFGLEPATVRVREVRIGRAERRAARRRAREARMHPESEAVGTSTPNLDEIVASGETVVTTVVSVGGDSIDLPGEGGGPRHSLSHPRPRRAVAGFVASNGATGSALNTADHLESRRSREVAREAIIDGTVTPSTPNPNSIVTQVPEELAALAAAAQFGPYTTFQQLSFAPSFPLGTIADDWVIPPTYGAFLDHRDQHEPDAIPIPELLAAPECPAVTEPPTATPPEPAAVPLKWFYIDPKGIVQGPWKAPLMQTWFNDGFLPPDLPVRKEADAEYTLLKEICAQAGNPEKPFDDPSSPSVQSFDVGGSQPRALLLPTSLLAQPKHCGPPALFFCSRGGHSTTIVDSRGRSVLRGRLNWTADDEHSKLGDIKRLEAFDTQDRAVVVAVRHGGIEVVDIGDALLSPADESRIYLPHFNAAPAGISRRSGFVWRLGTPIDSMNNGSPAESSKPAPSNRISAFAAKTGAAISPAVPRSALKSEANGFDEADGSLEEEALYLGRDQNNLYFCERTPISFRIFSLSTI